MRKDVERETAKKKKSRKAAESSRADDKRSSQKTDPGLEFDPGALLNSSDGMVFTASPDYRIEYMNEAAQRRIGRDLTGTPCFKVLYGFDERCPWCRGELVKKGGTIRQEILNPIDNRWYSSVLTPLQRKDGSIGLQSLVFDITDQKKSEAVLGQNEALLRSIYQAAPMGIGMVKNRVLEWTNEEISRMTGYPGDELKGKSARIFYPDDEEFDRVGRHKYADIRSRGTGSIVTVWRCKDGQPIHVYLSSTPIDPADLTAGVVFTALDITEKKKAQDELWRSEEKYRALFENAVIGFFQSTPQGRFLTVNPSTAAMCGYDSPGEMTAAITDIATQHYVDPEERDLYIRAIEEQSFVRNFEHRTWRKDGSVFWVSVSARAVKDRRGNVLYYEGIHEDVTRRKEAEEALRKSETNYREIFNSGNDGIFVHDPQTGDILDVNERACGMLGYTKDDFVGGALQGRVAGSRPYTEEEALKRIRLAGRGQPQTFEWQAIHREGHPIWAEVNLQKALIGGNERVLAFVRDITDRKQAEEALRQSEERFEKIFRSSPEPIAISSIDEGRYIDVNERFVESFGFSREEILGRTSTELNLWFSSISRDQVISGFRETGSVRNALHEYRTKSGQVRTGLWSAEIIRLGDRDVLLSILHDITERRHAEEKYQSILAEIDEFYYETDLRGNLTFFNDAACSIIGYNREELQGKNNREYTSPETAGRMYRVFSDVYRTGEKAKLSDYEVIRKDGSRRVLEISVSLKRDENGKPTGFRGLGRDVTERERAETDLRQSEERFSKAFHSSPAPMTIATIEEGRILDANDRAFELFGYSREEGVGRTAGELNVWEDPGDRIRLAGKLREKGSVRNAPARFRRKTGEIRTVLWSGEIVKLGDREVMLSLLQDITEQKEAEERLRQSEAKFRTIFENTLVGIFQSSPEGRYISVNPAFAKMFGYESPEEVISSVTDISTQIFVDAEERRRCLAILKETGILERFETRTRRKDGSIIWTTINSRVVRDTDGRPLFIEGVIENITERKHVEAERARLEQQLRQAQKMEAIGTLAGGIAHDFNNILFAVIGYTELCLQEIQDEESRWNLSQILSASNRAKTLVSQILTFSRQAEQERRPLNVIPLAKEALKFLRSSLPSTIDLRLDAGAVDSIVLADAAQIHQVFMNLCTNAAHAMRTSGGRLSVVIDNAAPPAALLTGEGNGIRPGVFVRLSVSDTGHGIDPDQINRIFDPFFTTKAPGEGTGLGLSVVYGAVKSLGGTIHVDSTPGRGSTFDIYLPSIAALQKEPDKSTGALPRGTESILFVDDESHLVEIMGQMLTALGYRVTTVLESPKALQLIREDPGCFDLVITDMTMPHMTGAELAREIFRIRPDMPIILCTGYSELIGEEEARRMGIRRFLMKPLFMGEVAKEIRAVLAEHTEDSAL